jgi:hypothetical protein
MCPAGETAAGRIKLNRPRLYGAYMKRSEMEAARPLPAARAAGPDRMKLKGRHATDAPAPSEREPQPDTGERKGADARAATAAPAFVVRQTHSASLRNVREYEGEMW